jgi:hypothetical protein
MPPEKWSSVRYGWRDDVPSCWLFHNSATPVELTAFEGNHLDYSKPFLKQGKATARAN